MSGGGPQLGGMFGQQQKAAPSLGGGLQSGIGLVGGQTTLGGVGGGGFQLGSGLGTMTSGPTSLGGGGGLQLGQSTAAGSSGLQLGGVGGGFQSGSSLGATSKPSLGGGLQLGSGIGAMSSGGLQLGGGFGTTASTSLSSGGLQLGGLGTAASTGTSSFGLSTAATAQQMRIPGLQLGGGPKPATTGLMGGGLVTSGLGTGGLGTSGLVTSGLGTSSLGGGLSTTGQLGTLLAAPSSQQSQSTSGLTLGGGQLGGIGLQLPNPQTTQPSLLGGLKHPQQTTTSIPTSYSAIKHSLPGALGVFTTLPSTGLQPPKTTATISAGLSGLTGPITTTTQSGGVAGVGITTKQYTYKELDEQIHKWSNELQSQEKLFVQEAQKINSWDCLLAENGDKITELNDEVEIARNEQKRLNSELDLICSQQSELEEILTGLEQNADLQQPLVPSHHADLQRTKIYQLAESVDGQLRRMEQDLKEIIEQINSSNTAEDEDNPMVKVVKILNAHADSLNWIDRNSALLKQKVDEVGKQTEQRRREQERSFRLAFDQ